MTWVDAFLPGLIQIVMGTVGLAFAFFYTAKLFRS